MGTVESKRLHVGEVVRRERTRRGWSVESAIAACGLGHMTWRRIERGERVQKRSYAGIDHAFGWPAGRTLSAIDADDETDPAAVLLSEQSSSAPCSTPVSSPDAEYDRLMRASEHLPLSHLRALTAVLEQRLNDHDRLLSLISNDVTFSHHPDVRQALTDYNPRLILRVSDALGQRYEAAYHDLWKAWSDLATLHDDYSAHVRAESLRIRDLEGLAERAREATATLEKQLAEFRAIERNALDEDHNNSTSA